MDTVAITIGRNIGGNPMDRDRWYTFKLDVMEALLLTGCTVVQRPHFLDGSPDQVGEWEGKHEQAAAFIALVPTDQHKALNQRLACIQLAYEQDAIGYVMASGDSNFVRG